MFTAMANQQESGFRKNMIYSEALQKFDTAYLMNWFYKILSFLTRRSFRILELKCEESSERIINRRYDGLKTVPLHQIRGSENRANDFNIHFHPMNLRDRERWVNVATAMMEDAALPPIELIHVNGTYFVRDGHHRVSVAKMIGQQEIDAIVTTWVCTLAETPCAKHAKKEKWATFFLTKWLHFPYRANGCIY